MGYIVHLCIVGGIGVIDVRRRRRHLLTAAGDKCLSECKQRDIKMHSPLDIVTRNAAKNNRQMNRYIYKYKYRNECVCLYTNRLKELCFCSISRQLSISCHCKERVKERDPIGGSRCAAPTPRAENSRVYKTINFLWKNKKGSKINGKNEKDTET